MYSFNPTPIAQQVMTANNVVILLGIQEIGFGQGVFFDTDFNALPLHGVGSQKPQEIQSQVFRPYVDILMLNLSNLGLTLLNYPSTLGDLLGLNQFNIVMMGYNSLPMYTFVECTATRYNVGVPVNRPIVEQIRFMAMDVLDVMGVSILTGNPYIQMIEEVSSVAGRISNKYGNPFI